MNYLKMDSAISQHEHGIFSSNIQGHYSRQLNKDNQRCLLHQYTSISICLCEDECKKFYSPSFGLFFSWWWRLPIGYKGHNWLIRFAYAPNGPWCMESSLIIHIFFVLHSRSNLKCCLPMLQLDVSGVFSINKCVKYIHVWV